MGAKLLYQPRTVDFVAFIYTIGYFGIITLAFFQKFPEANKDVLNVLIGILSGVMVKVVESLFNKDTANSATATTIRAMNATPVQELPAPNPTTTQNRESEVPKNEVR